MPTHSPYHFLLLKSNIFCPRPDPTLPSPSRGEEEGEGGGMEILTSFRSKKGVYYRRKLAMEKDAESFNFVKIIGARQENC